MTDERIFAPRSAQEAVAEAGEDRVYWALWEENHYVLDSFRESVIAERCQEAGYRLEQD